MIVDYDDILADLLKENKMLKENLDRANKALDLLINPYNGLQSNSEALDYIKTRRNRNGENEE